MSRPFRFSVLGASLLGKFANKVIASKLLVVVGRCLDRGIRGYSDEMTVDRKVSM